MSRRRLSRREFLRWTAVGTGAAVLAACSPVVATPAPSAESGEAPAAEGPPQIEGGALQVYWHPGHYYDVYQDVWAEIEGEYGAEINVEQFQWPDMRTKLLAAFAGGTPPDLMEGGLWTREFANDGYLEPLDSYIARDGEEMGFPEDWISNYPEQSVLNGQTYGIQLHLTCNTLVYNPEALEAAGVTEPPTTWEEFLAACQAVTESTDMWGYAPEYQVSQAPTAWMWQNDVQWWDPEEKVLTLNSPEGVEALQFQVDLVREHGVAPEPQPSVGYEGPANLFIGRKVAMITTGPWNIGPIRNGAPDLNWDIAPPLTGKIQTTYAAGTNMSISKDSQNKELAWEVMKRLTQPAIEAQATEEAGMLMPRKSWTESEAVASDPIIKKWAGIMVAVPLKPIFPYDMLVSEVYEKMFQEAYDNAMFGQMSAQEALDRYVEEGNLKLKQAFG